MSCALASQSRIPMAALIIQRTFVEGLSSVLLSSDGGWQVDDHHLKKSVGSWQELAHDDLQERFALKLLFVATKLDLELVRSVGISSFLKFMTACKDLEDWVEDELIEGTFEGLALVLADLGPLLGLWVEEVVAP